MIHRAGWSLVLLGLAFRATSVLADQFEQIDGTALVRILRGPDVNSRPSLTVGDLGAMPAWLRDTRSALVLATTDRGNPVRLLVVPELRKPVTGLGEPIPVVVLERLDVFDAANLSIRLASRREIVLFEGLPIDLDSGQIVPEGQGGDLVFRSSGAGGPRLETVGTSRMFVLLKPPALDEIKVLRPTPGRTVLPEDFAGRYRLFANGQWSGTVDLKVEGRGVVTGKFRSDSQGNTYPITGQVAIDSPQKVRFSISFPRARQEFEGYLWGEGKGAMAGTVDLLDKTFGFFAIREGGRVAPDGQDLGPLGPLDGDRPGRILVEIRDESLSVDGKPCSLDALADRLSGLAEIDPTRWILLRASADRKYAEVLQVAQTSQKAGILTVRFEILGGP